MGLSLSNIGTVNYCNVVQKGPEEFHVLNEGFR